MRPRRLLRLLSDFNGKVRYHPGKASVAADALSRNERAKPLRVRALVMTINSNLPLQIHEARVEPLKKENLKDKNLHGMDKEFENRLDGTLFIRRRNKIYHNLKWLYQYGSMHHHLCHQVLDMSKDEGRLLEAIRRTTSYSIGRDPDDKLHFIEEPVEIMDQEVKRLKQSRIPIMKVRWNSRRGPKFTWEREDQMKKKYPHLFVNPSSTS
ncbi:hypothetical protein Tco_0100008 [Tanacetum coccineum]